MSNTFSAQALDRLENTIGAHKLGQLFIQLGYLNEAKLQRALDYQRHKGGRLGWILATMGYITRLELYEGLARHFSLPFETDTGKILKKIDKKLALSLTHEEMMANQVIPYFLKGKTLTVLTAEPGSVSAAGLLLERFGIKKINEIIITDLDITKLSGELHRTSIMDKSINGLLRCNPEESASKVFTGQQLAFIAGFLCMLGAWLCLKPGQAILSILLLVQLVFIVPALFSLATVVIGLIKRPRYSMANAVRPFNEHDLPVYSILIPAYKEKTVIGNLIRCIKKLDYPEDKLDIILLLEKDDDETLQAAKAERPPANWRFLVCPESGPHTKFKALNYGLGFVRGEYLAVYDAEDLPERGQLKKAVMAFRTNPDEFFCFRSSLDYFNKNENLLTKMLSLENPGWGTCLWPGLFNAGQTVPLNGAGSHYNVKKLKELGAWDPFNVMGDTDLGVRASVEGYKTGIIESATYEEANSRLSNWLRQRSRWAKGYLQTLLVHNRHPLGSIRSQGFFKWSFLNLLVGGTLVSSLLVPVIWLLLGLSVYSDVSGLFFVPNTLIYFMGFNLIAGYLVVTLNATLAALRQKNYSLVPYALLSPVYSLLLSLAAYKGLWQLFTKPFYWEKTAHGLTRSIPASRTLYVPDDIQELVVVKSDKN